MCIVSEIWYTNLIESKTGQKLPLCGDLESVHNYGSRYEIKIKILSLTQDFIIFKPFFFLKKLQKLI
jgi:hypothetical protein